jgi:hypothetical protein
VTITDRSTAITADDLAGPDPQPDTSLAGLAWPRHG